MSKHHNKPQHSGSVLDVLITFLKLGFTSFGGPAAHIGYFRKELVERQGWVSEGQFAQLLAICQFLPGPASSQLGFALGLFRAGWLGALTAFLAFTLPSAFLLVAFAALLPYLSGDVGAAFIHGLKLVACVVVADAVWGMSKNLCSDAIRRCIAVAAAVTILTLGTTWSQLLVVFAGAVAGVLLCRTAISDKQPQLQVAYSRRVGLILLASFFALLLFFGMSQSEAGLYGIAQAFYSAGALVFGGGHVVLPLLEESVVSSGWVSQPEFLAGYGASQAIPGPMFAFAAYLGAIIPGTDSALLGAIVALLFMFLPGFLLISAVLPLWQAISQNTTALRAIAGVNAAVVGLLAAALYDPIITSAINSWVDVVTAVSGFVLLTTGRLSALGVVLWCVMASLAITLL
ncbi:chromate efflux transporter [Psychrobium sp. 1_MG-2023]|uniref:chromate efflux transporter n=1 Tax=Psychrobium sp. 1_MG-2023 TaxID=3062624 RepID=UPI000C33A7BC|nr:chromate efflux transporter [Psychrobium sp. 1_MG-2023]MDP2562595.1 chromate efflux transporter [Psychrobium sp. 1_MG-2023]PKF59640.1 chromate ion family chromate transporter [Alteromonadales bacterium alter-6D02]